MVALTRASDYAWTTRDSVLSALVRYTLRDGHHDLYKRVTEAWN